MELNLNTGADMTFRVDEEPGDVEGFWCAIDRAILRERGVTLTGPPPMDLFALIPRAALAGEALDRDAVQRFLEAVDRRLDEPAGQA